MTLTGSDTLANYQAALRGVTLPQHQRESHAARPHRELHGQRRRRRQQHADPADIRNTRVNDAPVEASIETGGRWRYTENDRPRRSPARSRSATWTTRTSNWPTVQITRQLTSGQDVLRSATRANITGSWNAATGTLTLTGSDTLANYQAALRSVTYQNTSENPSGPPAP